MKLFYEKQGSSPVVVLLHGYMSDGRYWDRLAGLLEASNTVVAVDLLGFGRSSKPRSKDNYSLSMQASAVAEVVDQLTSEPFTLVGHSMGSLVAARFADIYPKKVKHLVLSNMPILVSEEQTRLELQATGVLYRLLLYSKSGRLFWPIIKAAMPILRKIDRDMRAMTLRHNNNSRRGALRTVEKSNAPNLLSGIRNKTDLIIAKHDRQIYHENLKNIRFPDNILVHRVNTGHHTPIEDPNLLFKIISP